MTRYSIITGTYNQMEFLPKLVESLENQTFKDFEWVVCDDGSTDGTEDYIKGLNVKFPVKYVRQKNKGMRLGKNLNNGIKIAEGDYIVLIMGDSYPELNYLENLEELADEEFCICGVRVDVHEGKLAETDWRLRKGLIPSDIMMIISNPFQCLTGNGLVIPRRAFKEVGLLKEYKGYGGEDNEIISRLYYKGYIFWSTPSLTLYHHWHPRKDSANGEQTLKDTYKNYGK